MQAAQHGRGGGCKGGGDGSPYLETVLLSALEDCDTALQAAEVDHHTAQHGGGWCALIAALVATIIIVIIISTAFFFVIVGTTCAALLTITATGCTTPTLSSTCGCTRFRPMPTRRLGMPQECRYPVS